MRRLVIGTLCFAASAISANAAHAFQPGCQYTFSKACQIATPGHGSEKITVFVQQGTCRDGNLNRVTVWSAVEGPYGSQDLGNFLAVGGTEQFDLISATDISDFKPGAPQRVSLSQTGDDLTATIDLEGELSGSNDGIFKVKGSAVCK